MQFVEPHVALLHLQARTLAVEEQGPRYAEAVEEVCAMGSLLWSLLKRHLSQVSVSPLDADAEQIARDLDRVYTRLEELLARGINAARGLEAQGQRVASLHEAILARREVADALLVPLPETLGAYREAERGQLRSLEEIRRGVQDRLHR